MLNPLRPGNCQMGTANRGDSPSQIQGPNQDEPLMKVGSTERPLTTRKELLMDDNSIWIHLQSFDLCGQLTARSNDAVGHGAFSEVFKGRCSLGIRGEVTVAVKRLRFHVRSIDCNKVSRCTSFLWDCALTPRFSKLFESEIYVWSKLKHPHILPLLGYAFCGDTGFPLIISEWMNNGTAWNYLKSNPDMNLASTLRLVRVLLHAQDTKPDYERGPRCCGWAGVLARDERCTLRYQIG
jgi:hypothetical protein